MDSPNLLTFLKHGEILAFPIGRSGGASGSKLERHDATQQIERGDPALGHGRGP